MIPSSIAMKNIAVMIIKIGWLYDGMDTLPRFNKEEG